MAINSTESFYLRNSMIVMVANRQDPAVFLTKSGDAISRKSRQERDVCVFFGQAVTFPQE